MPSHSNTARTVTRLQHGQALEAAGYIRVSRKMQAEGHSPDVQREAIKRLAQQEGYALTLIKEDHERGSKVTRAGYQDIITAVRQGTIHAVLVFMFDRWGRDGAEWLARAREFERLGVPIISAQEGRDEGGLIRFVRAGMAEEESRKIARRVRPSREDAAREGVHCGGTPFGYQRKYPEWNGKGKRPPGLLVPHEPEAWVVRELYARYAAGGWSGRTLARWLNNDPRVPPPPSTNRPEGAPRSDRWSADTVIDMLRSETYVGDIRYNVQCRGIYEMAPPGSAFTVEGKHQGLVERDLWEAVQRRLTAARTRPNANGTRYAPTLASGLLVCAGCRSGMTTDARHKEPARSGHYVCRARRKFNTDCTMGGYRIDVAHAALLAEVRRLRGAPWTPEAEIRLLGPDDATAQRQAALAAELVEVKDMQLRHARRFGQMVNDPTPEEVAVFRQIGAEYAARITAIEQELATLGARAARLPALRKLHQTLTRTELADVVDGLLAEGQTERLREQIAELVASASVVERWPEARSTWVRMKVTWQPDVQALLEAGLLWEDEPVARPEPPPAPRAALLRRARNKRYYDRQKALRQAQGASPAARASAAR